MREECRESSTLERTLSVTVQMTARSPAGVAGWVLGVLTAPEGARAVQEALTASVQPPEKDKLGAWERDLHTGRSGRGLEPKPTDLKVIIIYGAQEPTRVASYSLDMVRICD